MTNDDTMRSTALALLRDGEANLSEVARLAGASRQLIRYWAKAAELDWKEIRKIRDAKLEALWAHKISKTPDTKRSS